MYYDRALSATFSELLHVGGNLRWLFELVRDHDELDFLTGKNSSKEWISVYYGLTRLISIRKFKDSIFIDTAEAYQKLSHNLYGKREVTKDFQSELEDLIKTVSDDSKYDRYYKNKKEGFYQSCFSRRFGICGLPDDDIVIIDKEAVIGYKNSTEKARIFGFLQQSYKNLQQAISSLNPKEYGSNLTKKSIGNELDFLALDKTGNILLIEFKHGSNCSGIYLSPLQIGLYYELFSSLQREELEFTIMNMLIQKQKIGLINPDWQRPSEFKDIIPVLVVSDYNEKSCAKEKFNKILQFVRTKKNETFLQGLRKFEYRPDIGLISW